MLLLGPDTLAVDAAEGIHKLVVLKQFLAKAFDRNRGVGPVPPTGWGQQRSISTIQSPPSPETMKRGGSCGSGDSGAWDGWAVTRGKSKKLRPNSIVETTSHCIREHRYQIARTKRGWQNSWKEVPNLVQWVELCFQEKVVASAVHSFDFFSFKFYRLMHCTEGRL